jgi:monoterpene epsilon-lactone hydrolase
MVQMNSGPREKRGIRVRSRIIPPPRTISSEAQQFLSQANNLVQPGPPPEDKAAWKAHIARTESITTELFRAIAENFPAQSTEHKMSASTLYEIKPDNLDPLLQDRAILYVHGGGFIAGGGIAAMYAGKPLAALAGVRVFSVDYRMPPDNPFPAGLNDVVEAYTLMLKLCAPEHIAVFGPSAGGGLAASFILKARDGGLPMPAAVVLHTPEADLTESGDTFETNQMIDVVLKYRLSDSIALYADGHDLKDPHLSPIFADFSAGFPPTVLTSGTRDLFLSNTVLMHRALLRCGIEAELQVWEAMPHGGFYGAPEDQELSSEHVNFIKKHLSTSR